ncbi:aspartate/glutamate racemase family protein [Microbacterium terrisoli]|uniref:aspartate/glutamate racemase family protein n=1 Tax=Microbacterium terrisoli TaxID=3242192 RepID=UPI0028041399|nr:aspartate/glutamate racemase family protein [Microbacterium protaetiae]
MTAPRIALVGAVAAAAPPAERAFAAEYPDAELWNLLDDRLISDALSAGEVTAELAERMTALIDYAIGHGAAGVLLTCSMYSPVAHAVAARAQVPVLASDDAAFADAAAGGFGRIALVASLAVPLADARARFDAFLAGHGDGRLQVVSVLAARAAVVTGDAAAQAVAIAEALGETAGIDAVLLAQYSISPAAAALSERLGIPVLAGPARAAARMRDLLA